MDRNPGQHAAYVAALVLVFVVGMLAGQQFCTEEVHPPEPEPHSEPETSEPPTQSVVFDFCLPPYEEEPEPERQPQRPESDEPEQESLPDSPPPVDPRLRQQLLGWARDQSSMLESCPRDLGETHRLGVTLEFDEDVVADVSISTETDEFSAEFESCVKGRILEWELPDDLSAPSREVFFHLTL